MNLRSMYPTGLGIVLTLLALSAAGQSTTGKASEAATTPKTTATANATSAGTDTAAAPASGARKHNSTAHHQAHPKHQPMASAGGDRDSDYRAALKSCVAGPAGQKDRCLDDAIARFGRSG